MDLRWDGVCVCGRSDHPRMAGEHLSPRGESRSANCRNIAISLVDRDFGEQTAQDGDNACLLQLSGRWDVFRGKVLA